LIRLVTGGDGYLVANERFLHFAIPDSSSVIEVEVRWPGGKVQRWQGISPRGETMLIEGRDMPVVLRTFDAR